jgi:hypothetical protein
LALAEVEPGGVRLAGIAPGAEEPVTPGLPGLAAMVPPGYVLVLVMPASLAVAVAERQERERGASVHYARP